MWSSIPRTFSTHLFFSEVRRERMKALILSSHRWELPPRWSKCGITIHNSCNSSSQLSWFLLSAFLLVAAIWEPWFLDVTSTASIPMLSNILVAGSWLLFMACILLANHSILLSSVHVGGSFSTNVSHISKTNLALGDMSFSRPLVL